MTATYYKNDWNHSYSLDTVTTASGCQDVSLEEQDASFEEQRSEPRVVVVIPAYNEERFIGSVILRLIRHVAAVVVIDDGSTENTAEIACAAGAIVIKHEGNRGKGVALNTGFGKAITLCPDVIVTIDADGQHIPEEISQVIEPIVQGKADIVIGSRYIVKNGDVPRHRVVGHWVFNRITHLSSGVLVSDSQSGYRAFSNRAAEVISFSSNGFSAESEMQFIAREHGLIVAEVPITAHYEDPPKRSVIAHGLIVLNGILNLIGQYRPLLFFGLPGFVLFGLGFSWGLWVVDIYSKTRQLATGYALISVMLCIVGLVMVHTGFILHTIRGLMMNMMRSLSRR